MEYEITRGTLIRHESDKIHAKWGYGLVLERLHDRTRSMWQDGRERTMLNTHVSRVTYRLPKRIVRALASLAKLRPCDYVIDMAQIRITAPAAIENNDPGEEE